ncbi:hypothetical protein [Pseudomonas anatoliensis]|uniref:hypothetical protein n=1 Tax=Pseudomonas anatoliensis TaxID=2710589 RepID=UPI001E60427C|nr:hypothetical protein [Pseudomonas anatoliensis]
MKLPSSLKSRFGRFTAAVVFAASPLWAQAGNVEVTALFRPDPTNPMVNKFTNTTPSSGYCEHFWAHCQANNLFSLTLPLGGYPVTSGKPVQANHPDPRQGAYLKTPSQWRRLSVTNESGDEASLEIRISGIGGRADHHADVVELTGGGGYNQLWSTGRWHAAPAPCVSGGGLNGTSYYVIFMWMVPENAGACATTALFDLPNFNYRYIFFGYELRTPNPLKMPTGTYRGSITYTVGPGLDFDFGDAVLPNDSLATIDFVLSVEHTLKVEIPPGGHRIELLPQGGWQAWLQRNRRPERLFRDQTFSISSSSRFKMQLECQYGDGSNTCLIRDPVSGDAVPLNIAVTLPAGMIDAGGQPVNRRPLLRDGTGTELFEPAYYVDRKPATLHFEVGREAVEQMLTGEGKTYTGDVTVIWDSQV